MLFLPLYKATFQQRSGLELSELRSQAERPDREAGQSGGREQEFSREAAEDGEDHEQHEAENLQPDHDY